jgi:hypothetical protein
MPLKVIPVDWFDGDSESRLFFDRGEDHDPGSGPVSVRELVAVCRECPGIPVGAEYSDLNYPLLAVKRACVVPELPHGNVLTRTFLDEANADGFDCIIFGTGACYVPDNPTGELDLHFAAPLLITNVPDRELLGVPRSYLRGQPNDPWAMKTDELAAELERYDPRVGVVGIVHGWQSLTRRYDVHHQACGGLFRVMHYKSPGETESDGRVWPPRDELELEFAFQ